MFCFGREEHLDALEVAVRAGCVVEREEESARRPSGERVVMVFARERERVCGGGNAAVVDRVQV